MWTKPASPRSNNSAGQSAHSTVAGAIGEPAGGVAVVNEDGTVDIYFAPEAPKGKANNWIQTGEDWFILFRLYGPDKPFFDQTWKPDDLVKLA